MLEPNWLDSAYAQAVSRLQQLIAIPSFSKEEQSVVTLFESWMKEDGIIFLREGNNLIATTFNGTSTKPTILLNSHTDTVKPNAGYTRNPFDASIEEHKLFGLGSNDAGGALICLYTVFKELYRQNDLPFNIIFAATAEEEISGTNGIESILPKLGNIDLAIVGEPTLMHLAIAEKGLLVIDCVAHGKAGHAARKEGNNAIYNALKDISWFESYSFPKISETLGEVNMSVTMMHAGTQHNVIPAECFFTVDIRCTDAYTHEELLVIIKHHVHCEVTPRSLRLRPSGIPATHPVVRAGLQLGRQIYGSPTSSDQALIPFPSVKIGPGDSARSHQADEFIYLDELKEGILIYHQLLTTLQL
ncbi:MAG: M20 family metallo-hydrolase [Bacteroidota bacterium]